MEGEEMEYIILEGKSLEKRPLGRPRITCKDIIKKRIWVKDCEDWKVAEINSGFLPIIE